jgi:hypothetical protein
MNPDFVKAIETFGLIVAAFVALIGFVSYIGPRVDQMILERWREPFRRFAGAMSWVGGACLSGLALFSLARGSLSAGGFLLALAAIQLGTMAKKKFSVAFRMTGVELFLAAFFLGSWIYGVGDGRDPPLPMGIGQTGFFAAIIGCSILVTAAWACYRVAALTKVTL